MVEQIWKDRNDSFNLFKNFRWNSSRTFKVITTRPTEQIIRIPAKIVEHNLRRIFLLKLNESLVLLLHHQKVRDRAERHAKLKKENGEKVMQIRAKLA